MVKEESALRSIHSSSSNEWYTPRRYTQLVRNTLCGINLDPASCAQANRLVGAKSYYTEAVDGLSLDWLDKWFCNPPYGRNTPKWVAKAHEQVSENSFGGILLVNAVPDRKWFRVLWDYPICFTDHRICFVAPDGEPMNNPTHGSAFVAMGLCGTALGRFVSEFSSIGKVINGN